VYSLSQLLGEAQQLCKAQPKTYAVLIAFEHSPVPKDPGSASLWLGSKDVSRWLRANGFDVRDLRQRGGIKFEVTSRDAYSAAENAAEVIDRLMTRVSLGTYYDIVPINRVWIAGEASPIPLWRARRRVEVHALSRENRVYSTISSGQIDAAIELAAPLNSQLTSAAIAGGWAAIESLLTGPGDKERILAAERMAAIAACSLPRAELTVLSYKLEEQGGTTADRLKACSSNRDRASVVAELIKAGTSPAFPGGSDIAALARISELLGDPRKVLHDIEHHISAAFRRLYRHRNMCLHWGRTDAVGVKSCFRAVAPLVGAGLDRIAHASFTQGIGPLELAARAQIRLATVGGTGGQSPLDLLETI